MFTNYAAKNAINEVIYKYLMQYFHIKSFCNVYQYIIFQLIMYIL